MDRRKAHYGAAVAALAVALLAGCSGGEPQGQGGQEGEVPPAPPAQQQEPAPAQPPGPDPAAAKAALQQQLDQAMQQQPITFQPDSPELTEQGRQTAMKAAELAKQAPQELNFTVTGYVADTGNPSPEDQQLSQQRAQAVADAFTQAGVPVERVQVVGQGPAQGGSESDRQVTVSVQ
ncbi:OmpA family protein [Saccharopolyspora sp. MS10]|uniref:OmpA family protein n=1 Tax=Saccharopolyspora sp. MS10 TaxID=3385973 RepID=UPI0039A2A889